MPPMIFHTLHSFSSLLRGCEFLAKTAYLSNHFANTLAWLLCGRYKGHDDTSIFFALRGFWSNMGVKIWIQQTLLQWVSQNLPWEVKKRKVLTFSRVLSFVLVVRIYPPHFGAWIGLLSGRPGCWPPPSVSLLSLPLCYCIHVTHSVLSLRLGAPRREALCPSSALSPHAVLEVPHKYLLSLNLLKA